MPTKTKPADPVTITNLGTAAYVVPAQYVPGGNVLTIPAGMTGDVSPEFLETEGFKRNEKAGLLCEGERETAAAPDLARELAATKAELEAAQTALEAVQAELDTTKAELVETQKALDEATKPQS